MPEHAAPRIDIQVETQYIPEQSHPEEDHYVFAYTIHIHNSGRTTAQLVSRHWVITDANGEEQEVFGEGVVGKKPTLKPGEEFSYTSGTSLPTPVGSMHGSYQMRGEDGTEFDAPIAPFSLATSSRLLN